MPPRTRSSLELIPNESTRKMTFRKRKKSIYKKAHELSKLCDIDVCLIVYEADQKKGRPVRPETWPEDSTVFNRILNKYKASKDIPASGLKQNFDLSDFYEAEKEDHVDDQKPEKLYPTWDDRIDEFSREELVKLIDSLEAKIQASTQKINAMERKNCSVAKPNQNVLIQTQSSARKAPHRTHLKASNHDLQKPHQVPAHQPCDESGASNAISISTTTMQFMPPNVQYPMLPSALVSSSASERRSNDSI